MSILYEHFWIVWQILQQPRERGVSRTSQTLEHIAKVRTALADNQRSTIRMLAEQFYIDKETICKIIAQDLWEKVVCAICSPYADVKTMGRSRNFLTQLPSNARKRFRVFS